MNIALSIIVLILLVGIIWLGLKWNDADIERNALQVRYDDTAKRLKSTERELHRTALARDWAKGEAKALAHELGETTAIWDVRDPFAVLKVAGEVARDQIRTIGAGLR